MGKVKVQGKIMDVRASNAGNAYKDQLYTATNGMLYDKERFIDIQLFHKGIGELGENIKMINQGLKGEIDEFGYGQRITQPFIAQSLMDRQKQRETQREIETDMITQGKINLLRQQGLLRDEERLGTFLPSGRNGMRTEIPAVQREAVEDTRMMVGELADRLRRAREDLTRASEEKELTPTEEQMLTQEERLRRRGQRRPGRPRLESVQTEQQRFEQLSELGEKGRTPQEEEEFQRISRRQKARQKQLIKKTETVGTGPVPRPETITITDASNPTGTLSLFG